jgi:SAM-dependent methyltransferase
LIVQRSRPRNWLDFFGGETPIYANARHKDRHYAGLARDIAAHLPQGAPRILDYGCGEALGAALLAPLCGAVLLFDASQHVRRKLAERFAGSERVIVLHEATLAEIKDASLDLIIVSSLIQYLSSAEIDSLLEFWRSKLKKGGALLLADVPTPQAGPFADALSLLAFGWREGFFGSALASLMLLSFSDYRRLRREIGFSRYEAAEVEALLRARGFDPRRLPRNLGHNQRRLAFIAGRVD